MGREGEDLVKLQREIDQLLDRWLARVPEARSALHKDAQYHTQFTFMRRAFTAMDMAMEDEGIPEPVRLRIIRTLVYGAPDEAEALARVERQTAEVERLKWAPPAGITVPEELLRGGSFTMPNA